MSSDAKLNRKMKRKERIKIEKMKAEKTKALKKKAEKIKRQKIKAEEIKKKFLKLKGYRIEVTENSYILFENEQEYLKLFYLEKVVFDFINNLLYNEDFSVDVD